MFYIVKVQDFVRVDPELFGMDVDKAIASELQKRYENFIDPEIGFVIKVLNVSEIEDGIILPEDGGAFHRCIFDLLVFKPELQELVFCSVSEITNFGAFMNIGPVEAMIHISQTMDDYVSFSKSNALLGRNTKKSLKKNDLCLARIVAISHKTEKPKIGLTMRQPGLGKLEWIKEEKRKAKLGVKIKEKS